MKKVVYISSLVFVYLLFTAKSCDNREQDDRSSELALITSARDSIRSAFAADTLSEAFLKAMETSAKNKFSDFCDYCAVLHDSTVSLPFREKAGEMIRGLYISGNSVLSVTRPGNHLKKEVSFKQILTSGRIYASSIGRVIADSVMILQPLHQEGDSLFTGKLFYVFIPLEKVKSGNQCGDYSTGTVDFLLIKHKKKFGTESLAIWDVFLGTPE